MPPAGPASGTSHVERLWPPASWWLVGAVLVASVWLVLVVATPTPVVLAGTGAAAVLVLGGLVRAGGVEVGVRAGELVAGRAHVPLELCGPVEALDADATRRARGVEADARAYLLLRPYLPAAVRVPLRDPADPTPYWLVSARDPERMAAAAAEAARAGRRDGTGRVGHDD